MATSSSRLWMAGSASHRGSPSLHTALWRTSLSTAVWAMSASSFLILEVSDRVFADNRVRGGFRRGGQHLLHARPCVHAGVQAAILWRGRADRPLLWPRPAPNRFSRASRRPGPHRRSTWLPASRAWIPPLRPAAACRCAGQGRSRSRAPSAAALVAAPTADRRGRSLPEPQPIRPRSLQRVPVLPVELATRSFLSPFTGLRPAVPTAPIGSLRGILPGPELPFKNKRLAGASPARPVAFGLSFAPPAATLSTWLPRR